MESIESLRSILVSSLSAGGTQYSEQELFDELSDNRPQLAKVFDFGPRNAQELQQLQSGKVEFDGRVLQVNGEFTRHAVFISQQLHCSERLCAELLHTVLSENPTMSHVDAVEQAILMYHHARRDLADCLRFIFEAAVFVEKGYPLPIHSRLYEYAKKYLLSDTSVSLALRIFEELTVLGSAITNEKVAVLNAASKMTVPATTGGTGNLGQSVLSARLESLQYERRTLAFAMYFIARAGFLTTSEIGRMIEWVEKNPHEDITLYILAALFAAFDLSHCPPDTPGSASRLTIIQDPNAISSIKQRLGPNWADASLKAAIQLKWVLFLMAARARNPQFEHTDGIRTEDLEIQIFNGVQGNAFTYLLRIVTRLGAPRSVAGRLLVKTLTSAVENPTEMKSVVTDEFKSHILHEIELLLRSLLTHAAAELRKIKHKQEDQFRPRSDRHVRASCRPETADSPHPRNDIATLFMLLGQLYSSLPSNNAIQFWGGVPTTDMPAHYELVEAELGKLPSFLRWAVEVREADLIISVFDMLAGLSKGPACSDCAYNFMSTGSLEVVYGSTGTRFEMSTAFTWGSIFSELESWASMGATQRAQHGVAHPQLAIAPSDVLLGLAFLRFLSVVVVHSVPARIAIHSHPQYRAIGTLLSLVPLGVPLELKGALFETVSAFCQPGAGIQGVEICKSVWSIMERLEVIQVRVGGFVSKGIEADLEDVESVHKVYPATIPFLELLGTLIHTPKRVPLKNRVTEPEPINTIPENLGQTHRSSGIAPYVSFVVDNILTKLPRREFLDPADSWRIADLALCFLERCVASYNLESLLSLAEEYNTKGPEALQPMVVHPGFDVLNRVLSDTPLRNILISYSIDGAEELQRQPSNLNYARVLLRALRILDRVLAIQDIYLDHLLPAIAGVDNISMLGYKVSQAFLSRIDQGLVLDRRSIPAFGSYVSAASAHPEIPLLAVKILSFLSQSSWFQNIATLIEQSVESTLILDGFVHLLMSESTDDVAEAEEWADLWTGAGAPDFDSDQNLFEQATRVAVLDSLLHGTKHNKASSLAFLLLFGEATPSGQIQDPRALGSREFCMHVILDLLNAGVPRLNSKGKERRKMRTIPLSESQSVLAERLYRLIYQLCEHPRTSSAMMLYIRTREDFFARHLAAMAVHVPGDARMPSIEVVSGDGSRVITTCSTLNAFLRLRSWLLDLVSLELDVLVNKGQNQRIKELLDLLFSLSDLYRSIENEWEQEVFRPFHDISQSRIRVIELFQSLQFDWYDSVAVTPIELQFYKNLNLQLCMRTDENGYEYIDRAALFELLSNARRILLRQGQILGPANIAQLEAETKYILESCVVENNRRSVQYALDASYESWKKLISVVLTKCFGRIAFDQREGILFDLLHVLPPTIRVNTLPEQSATILSEVLVLLMTKLREERHQARLLASIDSLEASALPAERMAALLRVMTDCILDKNRRELVRGNVYAALFNFLHLVLFPLDQPTTQKRLSPFTDISLTDMASSLTLESGHAERLPGPATSLEQSSLSVLKQVMDRVVTMIAKDALDGKEVWKTVAFTLLKVLSRLPRQDARSSVLHTLARYGLLSNFVHSIKDSDLSLQNTLKPEPEDLNSLFVYEAKMSFLISIAQTYQGAEKILDAHALTMLSEVDFLDARPERDESYFERNSFMFSASYRYHELLVPTLQLACSIMSSLGSKHVVVSRQTLKFLYSHRDTFVILLKEDANSTTLYGVEELILLVSLCTLVVPTIPQVDFLALNTRFGSLHNAILALSTKVLGDPKWHASIHPSDETETIEADTPALGYDARESKFGIKVRQAAQKLNRTLLSYLSVASSVGESELMVVLSPMLSTRRDERSSGVSIPLPALQNAIDVLSSICDELVGTMQQIADIAAELEHKDHIRIDNDEELVTGIDPNALRRLDVMQRRALVCRVLEETSVKKRSQVDNLLTSAEMLLHLIWTHIVYYSSGKAATLSSEADRRSSIARPGALLSQSLSHLRTSVLRVLSISDADSFRTEAASAMARVIEKLEGIKLNEDAAGRSWRSKQSYLETMRRCLRETLDLQRPESERQKE